MAKERKIKVSLAAVVSTNGLLTNGKSDMSWISKEDDALFRKLRAGSSVIIMGGNVYRRIKAQLKLDKPKLRVVLTRKPKHYQGDAVKDRLEFTNENPKQLLSRLAKGGHKNILLVSGAVSNLFIKDNLVDELHLTIEPVYFGSGHTLTDKYDFLANLKLISSKKLNPRGTMYLVYKFVRKVK